MNLTQQNNTFLEMEQNLGYVYPVWARVVISIFLSILIMMGCFGNLLVCFVFTRPKAMKTSINLFVVNLAVADILQSFNMIFMIIAANYGRWVLGDAMCQVHGFTTISFIVTSLITLFFISVNRYFTICSAMSQKSFFSKRNNILLIVFCWVYPALLAIAPVFGWSEYSYRPGKLMCTLKFSTDISYTVTLCASALFVPFAGICLSYYKIIAFMRVHRKRVETFRAQNAATRKKEDTHVAVMLGVVIASFMLFYLPSSTINFYELTQGADYSVPVVADVTTVLLAMMNHANNPVIYGFMNKGFQQEIRRIHTNRRNASNTEESQKIDSIMQRSRKTTNIETTLGAASVAAKET